MTEAEIINLVVSSLGKYGAVIVLLIRYVGPAIKELTPMLKEYLDVQKANMQKITELCSSMDKRLAMLEVRVSRLEGFHVQDVHAVHVLAAAPVEQPEVEVQQ